MAREQKIKATCETQNYRQKAKELLPLHKKSGSVRGGGGGRRGRSKEREVEGGGGRRRGKTLANRHGLGEPAIRFKY